VFANPTEKPAFRKAFLVRNLDGHAILITEKGRRNTRHGMIQAALTKRLPPELAYTDPSTGHLCDLAEGAIRNGDKHSQQGELRSTELEWLLRLTW
jgi:hypothetical protein